MLMKAYATLCLLWSQQDWVTSPEWIMVQEHPTDAVVNLSSAAGAGTAERPGDRGSLWALSAAFPEEKLDAKFHSVLSFYSLSYALARSGAAFVGKTMKILRSDSEEEVIVGGVAVVEIDRARKKNWLFTRIRNLLLFLEVAWKVRKRYGFIELLQGKEYKEHRDFFSKLRALGNTIDERIQTLHVPEPFWYLKAMSVHPDYQNQGIGTSILEKLNGLADIHNTTCYLTASGERAVRFYKSLGYEVVFRAEMEDPKGVKEPLDAVCMVRRPRPPPTYVSLNLHQPMVPL